MENDMTKNSKSQSDKTGALWRRMYWIKYALPCAGIWLLYWLAYFPGQMSSDSLDQWGQMLRFDFNDNHPAFHTLSNWLITRLWLSPAAVALAQIITMSVLIGSGLSKLRTLGVSPAVLWAVCGLFTLSPVMGMTTITLWKDIPYSMSILWLTLLLLEVITSEGRWLAASWRNMVLLGVASFCVSIFRHNGPPVALGTLLALGFVYRAFWKRVAVAFVIAITIYGAVHGPLYSVLGVKEMSSAFKYQVLLHQVAASVAAGTPLAPEEARVLDGIMPVEQLKSRYSCARTTSIIFDSPLNEQELENGGASLGRLWLSLLLRNPGAIVNHLLCSGGLVWNVSPFKHYLYATEGGIEQPNEFRLSTRPKLPRLHHILGDFVNLTLERKLIWLIWRPAIYLYGTMLLSALAAFRLRETAWLLFALPVLLQSMTLFLLCPAQDFRYQFSVYLVGLMSLCLPFYRKGERVVGNPLDIRKPA